MSWEIRQFGGMTLLCGTERFASSKAALAAGKQARLMLPKAGFDWTAAKPVDQSAFERGRSEPHWHELVR